MLQVRAKIIHNKEAGSNYCHLAFEAGGIARDALPGQFVNIRVSEALDPLLRRPISIHRIGFRLAVLGSRKIARTAHRTPHTVEILYEVVGKATQILSQKNPGEYLDIVGPLGNGFSVSGLTGLPVLVAGGMGVAPLLFLAENISRRAPRTARRAPIILIGAKTKNHILCENDFKKLGCEVKIATDDGSAGFKGYVSDLLKRVLSTVNRELLTIYACGPKPMLKEIAAISKSHKIPAQISLEEHMSCGIGACLGCVVDTKDGFRRVCKDGPVFKSEEIIW